MADKITKVLMIALAILALSVTCFAQAPYLEVSTYEITPSEVYAGASGYATLTITNTGDDNASDVQVFYDSNSYVRANDIRAGSSAQVSVPFKVADNAGGTVKLLSIDIYYTQQLSSEVASKVTTTSIPITILQQSPLSAKLISPNVVAAPGERVTIELELSNSGGIVNSLAISSPSNSTFILDGVSNVEVGSVAEGSKTRVNVTIVPRISEKGYYPLTLSFNYEDALGKPVSESFPLGLATISDLSSKYSISVVPVANAEIGSQSQMNVTIRNSGTSSDKIYLELSQTDTFTPIGEQRVDFGEILAGENASRIIKIGISSSETAGYYVLPLTLVSSSGSETNFSIGIAVTATPKITISKSGTKIQVSNTGNSAVRSVSATVSQNGRQIMEDFIGTLDIDDFETFTANATGTMTVAVTFTDTNNAQHTTSVQLSSDSDIFSSNSTNSSFPSGAPGDFNSNRTMSRGMTGGFNLNSMTSGLGNVALVLVGLIVAGVGGFFLYKRVKKGKETKETKRQ